MNTDTNGKITLVEWIRFMAAEFDKWRQLADQLRGSGGKVYVVVSLSPLPGIHNVAMQHLHRRKNWLISMQYINSPK